MGATSRVRFQMRARSCDTLAKEDKMKWTLRVDAAKCHTPLCPTQSRQLDRLAFVGGRPQCTIKINFFQFT